MVEPKTAPCTGVECGAFGVSACSDGFVSDGDHGCTPVLPQCKPGEIATPGACHAVGVATCGVGFMAEGAVCRAIAPNDCDGPTLTKLGEAGCVAISACETTRYPAVPSAIHVDGTYAATDSDGSEARPFARLADALAAVTATSKTIALAEGAYDLAVPINKPVEIVGVCPEKVLIQPPKGGDPIAISADVTLRAVGVSGGGLSVVTGETKLLRTWVHDTSAEGVTVARGARIALTGSVVSRATAVGVALEGAIGTITGSEIRRTNGSAVRARSRATLTVSGSVFSDNTGEALFTRGSVVSVDGSLIRRTSLRMTPEGSGIYADSFSGVAPTLTVRKTVIERTAGTSIGAYDGTATIEDTTVRDAIPSLNGPGIGILLGVDPKTKRPIRAKVVRSAVTGIEGVGVVIGGSVVELSSVLIRDGKESGHQETGRALIVITSLDGSIAPELTVADLLVERHTGGGIGVSAGRATFDRIVVRDILPEAKKRFGYGLIAYVDAAVTPSVLVRRSLIERTHDAGLISFGARLDVEDSVVRSVVQRSTGVFGHGIHISRDKDGRLATGSVRRSVISDVFEVGIEVFQSSVVIEDTTIAGVKPNAQSGIFGDGIAVTAATIDYPFQEADVTIKTTKVSGAARTAVAAFNSRAAVSSVLLRCNGLDLSVETIIDGHPPALEDGGANACGCDSLAACRASQSNLAPVAAQL